ncbi:Tripartite tricarboxylate transporter TctB family protein [Roseovarius marisflavi]|uniref:Tripartite tricarboxylate transporter TctB family protein n=1 Tax=Roseovarius marisflavi TaxID=1054996 RepID=A0A1M7AKJ0_9RHOB|nr:tripartite tricarboxylate transporter TctB family protein [Roseovarius marisflavi]SHL43302.1 Tripartite tricarboxylate transporter TctB family protein [Roseovarius marisflavi]
MSVRMAELMMGVCTLLISLGLMWSVTSNDLTVGWIEGRGPGAGMWPFWLSVGMALASIWTLVRWMRGITAESRNNDPYIDPETVFIVGITVAAIFFLLVLTSVIGLYFSMMLFLLFYIKFIGKHKWPVTMTVVIAMPVAIYMLFEVALNKYLPRGWPFFENIFLHIDDFRYAIFS